MADNAWFFLSEESVAATVFADFASRQGLFHRFHISSRLPRKFCAAGAPFHNIVKHGWTGTVGDDHIDSRRRRCFRRVKFGAHAARAERRAFPFAERQDFGSEDLDLRKKFRVFVRAGIARIQSVYVRQQNQ